MLDTKIIPGVGETAGHSLTHRIDRYLRNLFPVDPVAPHLNPTASILDYIHCGHINQWQRPVKWPIIIPASCRNEVHAVKMRYQKAANSPCIYKASQAFAPILSAVTNRKEPCIRQRDLLLMQGSAFRCLRDGAFYLFQANEAGPKIAFPYSYSTVAGGFGV